MKKLVEETFILQSNLHAFSLIAGSLILWQNKKVAKAITIRKVKNTNWVE